MGRVYILSAARTPVAAIDGNLRDYNESKLSVEAMKLAIELSGADAEEISEIVIGAAKQTSKPSNLARYSMLDARLPDRIPAYTVQRQSASGLQAVVNGVWSIKSGMARLILAGGCESMTHIPREIHNARSRFDEHTRIVFDPIAAQVEGAQPENLSVKSIYGHIAEKYGVTSGDALAYAAASLAKARSRAPADYICKLESRKGKVVEPVEADRVNPKPEIIAKPADGAAMLLLASEYTAAKRSPAAEILSVAAGAGAPATGIADARTVKKALDKAGVGMTDVSRIEIVEMNAAQVLATIMGLGLDASDKRINPSGGELATGNPWGASGTVHLVDLVHGLNPGETGVVINPAEGGQLLCAVIRKV